MEEKQFKSFFSDNMIITHKITFQGLTYPVAIYKRGRNLGTGASSDVYEVRQLFSATQKKDEGRELVVKQMKASQPQLYFTQQLFQNQIDALQYLKDLYFQKYFIKLQDYWKEQNYFYLIFEKCKNGSLNQLIAATQQYKKPLKQNHILYIAYSILRALQTLQSSNIIHQDIKTQNIMFDDDLCIKLIDFGLASKSPEGKKPQGQTLFGTIIYMAPELLQRENCFSQKVDIWSLGVLLYYIIFSKYPNTLEKHEIQNKQRFKICQMMRDKIVEQKIDYTLNQYTKANKLTQIIEIIKYMLEIDPEKRKNARELLGQSIFQKITVDQEQKIRKDLKQYYPSYFEMKANTKTKWREEEISYNNLQIPKQLLYQLQNKKKVQINQVLHIDKFGFFLLLSNNALYGYFNDHSQLKYHSSLRQQIQGYSNQNQNDRIINRLKILLYVQEKYFKQKMEKQQAQFKAEQHQNHKHDRMPFCSIHKIFYHKNSLFVRLSNKALQVFFESNNPSEKQINERFINKCLTFNTNIKYPERIYYRKDDRLLEFCTYKEAQKSQQCGKYVNYVRQVFRIILDNSCISLQKYGYQLVNQGS